MGRAGIEPAFRPILLASVSADCGGSSCHRVAYAICASCACRRPTHTCRQMRRAAGSLLVASLAALALTGCWGGTTPRATLATFVGGWGGHDRGMGINRSGRGFAQINSGAGCPCFGVAFQLSHVEGTTESATATETVVRLYGATHGYPATPPPLPGIGQRATLSLRDGIIQESFTGDDYCGPKAKGIAPCGA